MPQSLPLPTGTASMPNVLACRAQSTKRSSSCVCTVTLSLNFLFMSLTTTCTPSETYIDS